MADQDLTREKTVEIMREQRFVMLSSVTADGKIVSHPMTPQQVEDDASVWFFLGKQGGQADALAANPHVNLAFAETGSWLSVAGTVQYVEDRAKTEELWDGQVEAYFPGGLEDPNLGLVKFTADSAEYWGIPGNKAVAGAKIMWSKFAGTEAPGVAGTVEL